MEPLGLLLPPVVPHPCLSCPDQLLLSFCTHTFELGFVINLTQRISLACQLKGTFALSFFAQGNLAQSFSTHLHNSAPEHLIACAITLVAEHPYSYCSVFRARAVERAAVVPSREGPDRRGTGCCVQCLFFVQPVMTSPLLGDALASPTVSGGCVVEVMLLVSPPPSRPDDPEPGSSRARPLGMVMGPDVSGPN